MAKRPSLNHNQACHNLPAIYQSWVRPCDKCSTHKTMLTGPTVHKQQLYWERHQQKIGNQHASGHILAETVNILFFFFPFFLTVLQECAEQTNNFGVNCIYLRPRCPAWRYGKAWRAWSPSNECGCRTSHLSLCPAQYAATPRSAHKTILTHFTNIPKTLT
jgi:hypothetical protein